MAKVLPLPSGHTRLLLTTHTHRRARGAAHRQNSEMPQARAPAAAVRRAFKHSESRCFAGGGGGGRGVGGLTFDL